MNTTYGYALFDTAIGTCGIAWGDAGVRAVQLPDADARRTVARLRRRAPGAVPADPPAAVRRAVDGVTALLRGEADDLCHVRLDDDGIDDFDRRVYALARAIAPGSTLSYGEVAAQLGERSLARAVGQALARNPFAPVVPCHRVLAADGGPGGFSAAGGAATKLKMLQAEGWRAAQRGLFDDPPWR